MRAVVAEFLATSLLLSVVTGSGIMGDRLASGNVAVALLANSLATGAGLVALILVFGPVSGAHMNPVVTFAEARLGTLPTRTAIQRALAQIGGAFAGVALAHGMFELPVFAASPTVRDGFGQALGEFTATFCLLLVVLGCSRTRPAVTPFAVGAVITAGYWFTSSTSFANPAVTLARMATDTFVGIRAADVPAFLLAQGLGALAALATFRHLLHPAEDDRCRP